MWTRLRQVCTAQSRTIAAGDRRLVGAGIETAVIGAETNLSNFKQDLRNNDVYYYLAQGFRG